MIDVHSHILPGVDDGPADFGEAVEMCRVAAEDGCDTLIATPHQRHPQWWNEERGTLEGLRRALQARVGPHPRIYLGAEIRCDSEVLLAVDRLPNSSESGICQLAGSRYLLLEFGALGAGADSEATVHELGLAGWIPVLAHPERIPWLAQDLALVERLVKRGAHVQINAGSLTGVFGRQPREYARRFLDRGLAHFLASDCHRLHRRAPGLSKAARIIERTWGPETAWALTTTNPKAVLDDRPLQAAA